MAADTSILPLPTEVRGAAPRGLRDRWRRRRAERLERRRARHLALLGDLQLMLSDARSIVDESWVQEAWFRYTAADGSERLAAGGWASRVHPEQITGACLVGAIVLAAGGPEAAGSDIVRSAVDVAWHVLHRRDDETIDWTPDPTSRLFNVRDLTRWNDAPERSADDVSGLLLTAERLVSREILEATAR